MTARDMNDDGNPILGIFVGIVISLAFYAAGFLAWWWAR